MMKNELVDAKRKADTLIESQDYQVSVSISIRWTTADISRGHIRRNPTDSLTLPKLDGISDRAGVPCYCEKVMIYSAFQPNSLP